MDKNEILDRLDQLFYALQFSTQRKELLTVGERIVINQECGSLLHALDYPNAELKPVPETIETKIKELEHYMHVYNWRPFVVERFVEKENINSTFK